MLAASTAYGIEVEMYTQRIEDNNCLSDEGKLRQNPVLTSRESMSSSSPLPIARTVNGFRVARADILVRTQGLMITP